MKKPVIVLIVALTAAPALTGHAPADQVIVATRVAEAPVIDGSPDDLQWTLSRRYVTRDKASGAEMVLQAVYTDRHLFFLVQYPDKDESRSHKPWIWNQDLNAYELGPDREDTCVFKWSLVGNQVDLGIQSDDPYIADIWFWKAERTDPVGYADDKIQRLSFSPFPKTKQVISRTGKTGYLSRRGDGGSSAYKPVIHIDYIGDRLPQFQWRRPTGSRADVRAKGVWKNRQWTIEFSRALVTGHNDDIQFEPGAKYLFGISRFEIAGRKPDPRLTQPYYGSGDITEPLYLVFDR